MKEPARILIVDDRPTELSFLVKRLEAAGYDVRSVESGESAVASALANPPELVLLDVRLQGIDGLEVCRRLKSRAETRDIPIILVSAFADVDEWVKGLDLGAADYINKPFHTVELLARIKTHLSLSRTLALLKEETAIVQQTNDRLQAEIATRQSVEEELRRSLEQVDHSRRALVSALEEEKQAHEELRRVNALLDSIIENTPSMVLLKDARDLRIVRINRAGERLLSLSREELLGKTDHDLFPKSQADFFAAVDRKVIETRASVDIPEEPVLTPKGVRVGHTKKVPILNSEGDPEYVLGITADITESKLAQDTIGSLSSRLKEIVAAVPEILAEVDKHQVYTWTNQAGLQFFGADVIGKPAGHYVVGEQAIHEAVQALLDGREENVYVETRQRRKDGQSRLLAWWCRPLKDKDGRVRGTLSSARDITDSRRLEEEQRKLEEQVRASQKMEAIGSLAGGIAHDFNNLLCVLQSYTEFAIRGLDQASPVRDDLLAVKRAGERAATLVRQLLAFGRRQVLQPVPLNLNDVAAAMEKMLRRILGEDIDFVQILASDLGMVRADPGQIEQVLVNLVANARDAMPEGGRLTIETCGVEIEEDFADLQSPLPPGSYIQLSVSDTGIGMDRQTKARIFDPFFTTKPKGKGTGLGLSTVYGIVKQSGGGIWVGSEVGKGTTLRIYLPRDSSAARSVTPVPVGERPVEGTETILLVEDEEDLRKVARRALEVAGYTVLSAGDGYEAVQTAEEYAGEIHLLLTDVVMPRMGGRELARQLQRRRPTILVLYMSGYADDAMIRHGVLDAKIQLIGKPFAATTLVQKVRDVLDRGRAGMRAGSPATIPARGETVEDRLEQSALRELPEDVASALRRALVSARFDEMVQIVEGLAPTAPKVAKALRQRAERYDYDGIFSLLNQRAAGGKG